MLQNCVPIFILFFSPPAPQNHVNPAVDFTQIPPGMLALDNMLYFARHHQDAYIRVSPPSVAIGGHLCAPPQKINTF